MKGIFNYLLLAGASVALAFPTLVERDDGEDCDIEWVTVEGRAPTASTSSSAASATDLNSAAAAAAAASSSNSTGYASSNSSGSALDLPNLPDGTPPFPLNGDHKKAPVATDAVPSGAAVFTPSKPGVFDTNEFYTWMTATIKSNSPSKWMKIAPGTYSWALVPAMPDGTDANTVAGANIAIYFLTAGWTLDMRDTVMYISVTPENAHQRPGCMVYFDQVTDLTVLGGEIWIDQGELFTQATVTDVQGTTATFTVDQGYNVSAWRSAGPRNQRCIDVSNSQNFTWPECNYWHVSNYNFDSLDSKRTFTATIDPTSNIKKGLVNTIQLGPNSPCALSSENNDGLHIKGLTTNGALGTIGQPPSGKKGTIFENIWMVNPPNRPGFAPRVTGPALSWGNIGGMIYHPESQPVPESPGSWWQVLAAPESTADATVPYGG